MSGRTLVAGIGNVFLGDDGFGVAVAARLSSAALPHGVRVLDAGIRARDLAYELFDGAYDTAILVDAVARGGAPGTVYVIDPDVASIDSATSMAGTDGHALNPEGMLALVRALGGVPTRILIVGCEPASVEEGIGLSRPVAAAVDDAIGVVWELLCA